MSQAYFVYILECADRSYYTGFTSDLEFRLSQHQTGAIPGYTHSRRPVSLKWHEVFATRTEALAADRQIKGWSRAKKKALMRGDFELLKKLSRSAQAR